MFFILAVCTLLLSSLFNAGLTAMIEPLVDNVLSEEPSGEAKTDKILNYKENMQKITNWLEEHGVSLPKAGDMSPLSWAIIAMIFFCCEAFFDFLGTYLLGRIGLSVVVKMRQDIIDRVMALSMRFFSKMNSGEILTRLNSDLMRIQTAISVKMGEMVKEITRTFTYLLMAFFLNWKLSFALFLLVPMVGYPIQFFTRKIRKYSSRSQGYLGELTSHFKEVLVGIRIVKGFQRESFESEKLGRQNQSFFRYALRELVIIAMTRPVMSAIGMVVLISFVTYGSLAIKSGETTSGQFILYIVAIYNLYQPIKRIARANSEIQQAVGILPRIQELMEWKNEVLETATPVRFEGYPNVHNIHFDGVYFDYAEDASPNNAHQMPAVLNNIQLQIKQGTVVALVGSSGSGKSSMVTLLSRFYDVKKGAIKVNGVDIRDMSKTDLRALFALVTQDTILFDDTVFNNIAYGCEDIDPKLVEDAARKAFAHHFIEEMPNGYQTRIGENGGNLSGGQRQRLSIARAILKDAPVLILDEATSALDTESEKEVQMALDNLMKTKTTLVIAHRLSTIRNADQIVVLDQGKIVEQGTHRELLAQNGTYRKLIQMQEEGRNAL